ncbi:Heparan-alpha-glucosaminide N-acetyltransferase [Nymphaea thermarum]|nr:Heparan-alpha-glucosaminide N-acetyltransferase [Nymphaea thermarum]
MAHASPGQQRMDLPEGEQSTDGNHQKTKRVASLDIFRGLTVVMMILVDDAGDKWPIIGHAPWNGCHLADFVMPFFLFIVGMSIALSLKRIPNQVMAVKKVVLRTLKLLLWGLILQGGYSHAPDKLSYGVDMKKIRWCGILQRIALAYLIVAMVEIVTRNFRPEASTNVYISIFKLVGACLLVVYMGILYGLYVPDWEFTVQNVDSSYYGMHFTVHCGARGRLDPPCNAVGYVDTKVLGINHMYQHPAWRRTKACTKYSPYEGPIANDAPAWCHAPFEPEGVLSSISAVLTTIIGVHFGHVLVHLNDHSKRLTHWMSMGLFLLFLGLILHITDEIPLNKQLYSFSYFCLTAGAAALTFSAFYALWIGMNAMLVFVMAAEGIFDAFVNGWYYDNPHNTLVNWIKKHVFINVWHSEKAGILLYVIFGEIVFWAVVSGVLHRLGIYWKL